MWHQIIFLCFWATYRPFVVTSVLLGQLSCFKQTMSSKQKWQSTHPIEMTNICTSSISLKLPQCCCTKSEYLVSSPERRQKPKGQIVKVLVLSVFCDPSENHHRACSYSSVLLPPWPKYLLTVSLTICSDVSINQDIFSCFYDLQDTLIIMRQLSLQHTDPSVTLSVRADVSLARTILTRAKSKLDHWHLLIINTHNNFSPMFKTKSFTVAFHSHTFIHCWQKRRPSYSQHTRTCLDRSSDDWIFCSQFL